MGMKVYVDNEELNGVTASMSAWTCDVQPTTEGGRTQLRREGMAGRISITLEAPINRSELVLWELAKNPNPRQIRVVILSDQGGPDDEGFLPDPVEVRQYTYRGAVAVSFSPGYEQTESVCFVTENPMVATIP